VIPHFWLLTGKSIGSLTLAVHVHWYHDDNQPVHTSRDVLRKQGRNTRALWNCGTQASWWILV